MAINIVFYKMHLRIVRMKCQHKKDCGYDTSEGAS